jgi:hypothetical protein
VIHHENNKTLARLRQELRGRMASTVREIEWRDSPPSWTLFAERHGVTCRLDDLGAFFTVDLDHGRIVDEIRNDDVHIVQFLEGFDKTPLTLVSWKVGRLFSGWWIAFDDGVPLGRKETAMSRLIRALPGYEEATYVVSDGASLPLL